MLFENGLRFPEMAENLYYFCVWKIKLCLRNGSLRDRYPRARPKRVAKWTAILVIRSEGLVYKITAVLHLGAWFLYNTYRTGSHWRLNLTWAPDLYLSDLAKNAFSNSHSACKPEHLTVSALLLLLSPLFLLVYHTLFLLFALLGQQERNPRLQVLYQKRTNNPPGSQGC